jgi:hypothetical protein
VIATASARDPSNPDPVAFVPILVGLDSYSDITVAAPELVYNKRKITESVSTGAGASDYFEGVSSTLSTAFTLFAHYPPSSPRLPTISPLRVLSSSVSLN